MSNPKFFWEENTIARNSREDVEMENKMPIDKSRGIIK